MALATYADLQTAVPNWLGRPGDSIISAVVADLVVLCESRIHYGASEDSPFPSDPLRVRAMETTADILVKAVVDGGTVGGTANAITLSAAASSYAVGDTYSFAAVASNSGATTVNVNSLGVKNVVLGSASSALSGGEIVIGARAQIYYDGTSFVLMPGTANAPLPSNYLAMRSLYFDTNPRDPLEYVSPNQMNRYASAATGRSRFYTIEGDALRFGRAPDSAYVGVCAYYKKFPALATASTNWLLTNKPDVYLYGTLLETCLFLSDDAGAQKWQGFYKAACNGLQAQDERDRHSGSTLTIRNTSGNP